MHAHCHQKVNVTAMQLCLRYKFSNAFTSMNILSLLFHFTQTEIFCSESPAPQNGTMSIATASNENRYSLGSVARYSCNTGFALLGQTTRVCEDTNGGTVTTATWSGSLPTCESTAELSQFTSAP